MTRERARERERERANACCLTAAGSRPFASFFPFFFSFVKKKKKRVLLLYFWGCRATSAAEERLSLGPVFVLSLVCCAVRVCVNETEGVATKVISETSR